MILKGARPTPRDTKLLRLLFDYGVASTTQISTWLFEGIEKTTVLRRLRRLEEGGFLRKRGTLPDGTAVLMLAQDGAHFLGERLPVTTYPRHLLIHEIEIGALRWRLDQMGVVKSWMTERTLRCEIMRRNPGHERTNLIVPDALILFKHFIKPGAKVEFEMELHMKSDQRYKARFQKFDPARQKSSSFHWYVVRAPSCGEKILQFAAKYAGPGACNYLGYRVLQDFDEHGLEAKLYFDGGDAPLHRVFGAAQGGDQALSRDKSENPEARAA